MSKSIYDKLFFVDKIFEPVENIIDFGCADGELIRVLRFLFPKYHCIGYENNVKMLQMAKLKNPDIEFCSDWSEVASFAQNGLLNLSSVIHEIYSYESTTDVQLFWSRVFDSGFKYVCIRDMMLSEADTGKSRSENVIKVRAHCDTTLKNFEDVWGSIENNRNLVHYLLKYRYVENWDRENNENYLPITKEYLLSLIPNKYEIVYSDHFILPYIAHQIKKDFDVVLNTPTHFKLILKLKNEV